MRNILRFGVGALLVALVFWPAGTEAQQGGQQPQAAAGQAAEDITLVYEREVYTYSGEGRRNPFRPLTSADDMGPRFEALLLQGIIHLPSPGRSLALIADGTGRVYRVRAGDMVGTSRVIEIGPRRVVLAVENFGTTRQEILELPSRRDTDR